MSGVYFKFVGGYNGVAKVGGRWRVYDCLYCLLHKHGPLERVGFYSLPRRAVEALRRGRDRIPCYGAEVHRVALSLKGY